MKWRLWRLRTTTSFHPNFVHILNQFPENEQKKRKEDLQCVNILPLFPPQPKWLMTLTRLYQPSAWEETQITTVSYTHTHSDTHTHSPHVYSLFVLRCALVLPGWRSPSAPWRGRRGHAASSSAGTEWNWSASGVTSGLCGQERKQRRKKMNMDLLDWRSCLDVLVGKNANMICS